MSKETAIVQFVPVTDYAITQFTKEELQEAFADNLGENGKISMFDLPRVKLPSGGGKRWVFEDEDPETFEGIIVAWEDAKDMWIKEQGEGGGNTAPDCSGSLIPIDALGQCKDWFGVGKRWEGDTEGPHECRTCPYNEFGSGKNGGKKCKDTRILAILRPGDVLPTILVLSPKSIGPFKDYLMKDIMRKGRRFGNVVTRFGLYQTQNAQGTKYCQATFTNMGDVPAELLPLITDYSRSMKGFLAREARKAGSDNGPAGPTDEANAFVEEDLEDIPA